MKLDKKQMQLYAVTDRHWLNGKTLVEQVEEALIGGVTILQLREKTLNYQCFVEEAKEIKELCHKYNVPFIINDNIDVAVAVDADGVHLGQDDMDIITARKKLGDNKIIGVSAHNVDEALLAEKNGADYLGSGAVFPTGSKDNVTPLSKEVLKKITDSVSIPVVAIGGITYDNLSELSGTGIDGVAVISAIFAQTDIKEETKKLKEKVLTII